MLHLLDKTHEVHMDTLLIDRTVGVPGSYRSRLQVGGRRRAGPSCLARKGGSWARRGRQKSRRISGFRFAPKAEVLRLFDDDFHP